jgi:hypothetical protein
MTINTRPLLLLGAALALAGCHHDGKSDDQRTAAGQVLSGSISDGMLPYDTLRSQPPLAPTPAAGDASAAVSADSGDMLSGDTVTDTNGAPPAEGGANPPPR